MSGRRFLVTEDGEDSAAGPLQCTYLRSEVHERVLTRSRQLATQRRKKAEVVEANRVTEEQERVESKVESTIGGSSQPGIQAHSSCYRSFVLFFGLPLNEQHLTPALHAPSTQHGTWSGTRHHTNA